MTAMLERTDETTDDHHRGRSPPSPRGHHPEGHHQDRRRQDRHHDARTGRGLRPRARRDPRTRDRRPRRARRHLHPPGHQGAARASRSAAGRCCSPASCRPPGSPAPRCSARRRSSTTWRSATTSCTASTTGWAIPRSPSRNFEWDSACPSDQWRHSHNYMHHTHTNIVDMDRDIGYGILRMSEDQKWRRTSAATPSTRSC